MIRLFLLKLNAITEVTFEQGNIDNAINMSSWVDVLSPSEEERSSVEKLLKAEVPDAEDFEEIEDSARCFVDQVGIHVHSLFLARKDERHEVVSVACILQQDRLVTVRDENLADFRLFRMRAKRGQIEIESPASLLISLLEQKVENLADILESIHRDLENIGASVLGKAVENPETIVSELAMSEDTNGKIRLCLMDTRREISFLQRHLKSVPEIRETCREISRDIDTLLSHTTFLFDKINFLMDFMQNYINIQQNQIIKIFSIAAVVFLPPTLVASIYGMNFDFIPELNWRFGYPLAIFLMILSGVTPYWYFKRKGWL